MTLLVNGGCKQLQSSGFGRRQTGWNKIVASSQFLPKDATLSDREAGMCIMSQDPTQAVQMISSTSESQLTSQPQEPIITDFRINDSITARKEVKYSAVCNKKRRLSEDGKIKGLLSSGSIPTNPICKNISTENTVTENGGEVSKSVPDVASAIEDLLEQTSKIHDQMSPDTTATDKNVSEVFTSNSSTLEHDLHGEDPHSAFGLSKHWTRRCTQKDDTSNPNGEENTGIYGGFSETQTESQVVSYEEDLSGRQMIIDRVRSSNTKWPHP